jgi:MFS family permease
MSAASATTFSFAAAMFGAMFLIPLYYQVVRGQSALHAGLLLAPQGVGAAIMMPIAGKLTDQTGPGRVVLGGLTLLLAGMIGFTQVGADTSYWLLGSSQLLVGLGMGAAMMPSMTAAYQTIQRHQMARATTALNIIQRVGGSIGTALLSVVLAHQLSSRLPAAAGGDGALGAAQNASASARAAVAPQIADAFGSTFWWAAAILVVAFIPALMLPRHKPQAAGEAELPAEAQAEAIAA